MNQITDPLFDCNDNNNAIWANDVEFEEEVEEEIAPQRTYDMPSESEDDSDVDVDNV